ncbi:MAG: energy-converting hydrogenase A subunit R EhaR [Parcubacteria group bacterium LiPW_39]|nr:MAG: energy-converting hydrogenase A subunit R EhaR [Parcubacteria group bacterium LiPW_39]
MFPIVVASDIEYTLGRRDFGFEVVARILGEQGRKLYEVLSAFDDVMGLFPEAVEDNELRELAKNYVPGTTPILILPFLAAFCDFNGQIVEDLAEITDLRMNKGVTELIAGLKRQGAHVVLISSACGAFARRNASDLNLPYYYASAGSSYGGLSAKTKKNLKNLAMEIADSPVIEFKGSELVRDQKNDARIREGERSLKKLGAHISLSSLTRTAIGGSRKTWALKHAVEYATGAFGSPLEPEWLNSVVYLGDSITDESVLAAVSQGGGLAVSVNGNAFALKHADVAVISRNLGCISGLIEQYTRLGKEKLFEEIDADETTYAEQGIFLNNHSAALSILSGRMRADLKGEKAVIN